MMAQGARQDVLQLVGAFAALVALGGRRASRSRAAFLLHCPAQRQFHHGWHTLVFLFWLLNLRWLFHRLEAHVNTALLAVDLDDLRFDFVAHFDDIGR